MEGIDMTAKTRDYTLTLTHKTTGFVSMCHVGIQDIIDLYGRGKGRAVLQEGFTKLHFAESACNGIVVVDITPRA